MLKFSVRFCFAPMSSSPSIKKTGMSLSLANLNSGTLPPSDTSVILARFWARASSKVK